jgi:hypothetical protein
LTDLQRLIRAVLKTAQIDESGDANLFSYLEERPVAVLQRMTVPQLLEDFLVWANGEEWDPWIWTAQVGEVPPKGKGE